MNPYQSIVTSADCEAVLIPAGSPVMIPAGSVVQITQALGGHYTLLVNGNLVRVAGKDAAALGLQQEDAWQPEVASDAESGEMDRETLERRVQEQLANCYDPEIPINIVELGLIYQCDLEEREDGRWDVRIVMTLTAPGCGMGEFLVEDVRCRIATLSGIGAVNVELSFDPPWSQDMMSDEAKLSLGLY